jgi:hypothetical protein
MNGSTPIEPAWAASRLAGLGFLASSDLPDRPGPAFLLVALREQPTLRHFDPELVEYWVTEDGRGVIRTLTRASTLPLATEFSWGLIRITDRLHVTNEYLSFGGSLRAERVGDLVVATFTSPAPLLRRGGHSQGLDPGADALGAWFGRLLLAVDFVPGFERRVADAPATARYAGFLSDAIARYRSSEPLRTAHPDLCNLLVAEARRVRDLDPAAWRVGEDLRAAVDGVTRSRSIGPSAVQPA